MTRRIDWPMTHARISDHKKAWWFLCEECGRTGHRACGHRVKKMGRPWSADPALAFGLLAEMLAQPGSPVVIRSEWRGSGWMALIGWPVEGGMKYLEFEKLESAHIAEAWARLFGVEIVYEGD